jgi:hypothetical protein
MYKSPKVAALALAVGRLVAIESKSALFSFLPLADSLAIEDF